MCMHVCACVHCVYMCIIYVYMRFNYFIFLRQIEASPNDERGLYTVVSASGVSCLFPTSINFNLIGHAMLNLPGYLP